MERSKSFTSSYMLLNADEVGFFDLFRILFQSDIDERKFVDAPGKNDESFHRRWLIFLSILVQKLLFSAAKPMASVGSAVEFWLNLLDANHGLGRLLMNLLKGSLVVPKSESSTYLSYVGYQDKRWELDNNIKPGDHRYYPLLSIMASKLCYENGAYVKAIVEDRWNMQFLGSFDFWNAHRKKGTTQASMFQEKTQNQDTIIVAFRGTSPFDAEDWASDFDISWYNINGIGNLHGGFMKALGLQPFSGWPREYTFKNDATRPLVPPAYYAIRDHLRAILRQNESARFVITGHSLGGALAILFVSILSLHDEREVLARVEGVYTFGQPRVGDARFGMFMDGKLREHSVKYLRFVYCNDMVPRLPMDDSALMFRHFGTCVYYNSFYGAEIIKEEPNKNYFSIRNLISMMVTSVWELLRSFLIGFLNGPEYAEGWFMIMFRVIGLAVPGLSGHCTLDYINATRLAPEEIFLLPKDG